MDAPTDKVVPQTELAPQLLAGGPGSGLRERVATIDRLQPSLAGVASPGRDRPFYRMNVKQTRAQAEHNIAEMQAVTKGSARAWAVTKVGKIVNAVRPKGTHQPDALTGKLFHQ